MPDDLIYEYNKADRRDVLRHAKALEGKVIGDVYRLEQTGKQRPEMLEYYAEIHIFADALMKDVTVICTNIPQCIYLLPLKIRVEHTHLSNRT